MLRCGRCGILSTVHNYARSVLYVRICTQPPIIMRYVDHVCIFESCVTREKDAITTATRKLDWAKTSASGSSTGGIFRSRSLAPRKPRETRGNGYYYGLVVCSRSRCTLTLLQQLDWYDRFVVLARSQAQVSGVVAGFQV